MLIRRALVCLASIAAAFAQVPDSPKPAKPTCVSDSEDQGRPKLKRGIPKTTDRKPVCEELAVPIGPQAVPEDPPNLEERPDGSRPSFRPPRERDEDEVQRPLTLIDKARLRAETYSSELPNFICQQLIRRSSSGLSRKDWRLQDTVTVDVAYVDGREEYKNAKRNNKKMTWEETKKSGSWSEGEYGTVLVDILHPATNAKFTRRGVDNLGDVVAEVWDFVVEKENSHWNVAFGGQATKPKYRGALWIDPKEHLVRRIEMEGLNFASTFPVNHAELTIDYGPTRIGTKMYVLPIKTQNLACFTQAAACSTNETEFRNYRKFSTESTISTTDSSVSFDGEQKPPAATPPPTRKK